MSIIYRAVRSGQRLPLSASTTLNEGRVIGSRVRLNSRLGGTRELSSSPICSIGEYCHKWSTASRALSSRAPFARVPHSRQPQHSTFSCKNLASALQTQIRYCSRTAAQSSAMTSKGQKSPRLPTDVKPTHYDLTVRTDLEKLVFDGWVTIE
jgi:hypothetical protein